MRSHLPAIRMLLLLGVLLCSAPGCSRESDPGGAEPALLSSTRSGPVQLRVESSVDSLRTVDRIEVRVLLTLEDGATLDELTIDPEGEGWTVVSDRTQTPAVLDNGAVLHRRTLTLEPFLEGDYTIPSVSAAWSQGERSGVAVSEALAIAVRSVLEEDDTLEIGELREAPPAVAPVTRSRVSLWVTVTLLVGVSLLLAIATGLVLWLRRGRPDPARAIVARLERVASGAGEPGVACAEAAAALRTIAPDSGADRTRDLIDRLDDARFDPDQTGSDRAMTLVRDAVEHARLLLAKREARA